MKKTAFLSDKIYMQHDTGFMHPERPKRISSIYKKISSAPYFRDLLLIKPEKTALDMIEMVHSQDYIYRIKKEIEDGADYLDSPDTPVSRDSFDVALYAVGGCLKMCDAVMSGAADRKSVV